MSNIIERAFALAAESQSLREVRVKLKREGFGNTDVYLSLSGRLIRTQLNERLLPIGKERRVR